MESLVINGSDLVQASRALIEVIKTGFPSGQNSQSFLCVAAKVEGHCAGMTDIMARLNGSLEQRLKLFELSKNVPEQARNWLLSILASVFLPVTCYQHPQHADSLR
jgi:hypothetical protein